MAVIIFKKKDKGVTIFQPTTQAEAPCSTRGHVGTPNSRWDPAHRLPILPQAYPAFPQQPPSIHQHIPTQGKGPCSTRGQPHRHPEPQVTPNGKQPTCPQRQPSLPSNSPLPQSLSSLPYRRPQFWQRLLIYQRSHWIPGPRKPHRQHWHCTQRPRGQTSHQHPSGGILLDQRGLTGHHDHRPLRPADQRETETRENTIIQQKQT